MSAYGDKIDMLNLSPEKRDLKFSQFLKLLPKLKNALDFYALGHHFDYDLGMSGGFSAHIIDEGEKAEEALLAIKEFEHGF